MIVLALGIRLVLVLDPVLDPVLDLGIGLFDYWIIGLLDYWIIELVVGFG